MSRNRLFAVCLGLALAATSSAIVTQAAATDEGREVPATQGGAAEKEAFDSAKALGTVEAWEAFLSHYPGGFRADLARAYVRQLGAQPVAGPAGPAAPARNAVTRVRYPGGEFIKNGATSWVEQGQSGRAIFRFEETGRSAQAIELYDSSRSVFITLDVASRIIWYKDSGSARGKLYDIVETASNPASNPAPQTYAAAGTALQPALELSCREQSTIASSNSNTPAKITFINNSAMDRAILWIDFKGQTKNYADLGPGQQVTLETFLTHPWLVTDGPGNCVKIVLPEPGASVAYLDGGGRAEPAYTPRRTEPKYFSTRPKRATSSACGSGKIRVDGKCMRRADAAGYCGPGYRPQGGKCVQGYRAPKASDGVPSWQKEAIKKGCPAGMAWNKFEGCHEND